MEWLKNVPTGAGGPLAAIALSLGLVAWGLKFVRGFQADFTDKYQARVKELEAEVDQLRHVGVTKDRLISRLRLGVARAIQTLISHGVDVPQETLDANDATEDD